MRVLSRTNWTFPSRYSCAALLLNVLLYIRSMCSRVFPNQHTTLYTPAFSLVILPSTRGTFPGHLLWRASAKARFVRRVSLAVVAVVLCIPSLCSDPHRGDTILTIGWKITFGAMAAVSVQTIYRGLLCSVHPGPTHQILDFSNFG
jgi:hypothetical protein